MYNESKNDFGVNQINQLFDAAGLSRIGKYGAVNCPSCKKNKFKINDNGSTYCFTKSCFFQDNTTKPVMTLKTFLVDNGMISESDANSIIGQSNSSNSYYNNSELVEKSLNGILNVIKGGEKKLVSISGVAYEYTCFDSLNSQFLNASKSYKFKIVKEFADRKEKLYISKVIQDGTIYKTNECPNYKSKPVRIYNINSLLRARDKIATIYITEGEKDCDTLYNSGFQAISLDCTAKGLEEVAKVLLSKQFKDVNFIYVMDNDAVGYDKFNDLYQMMFVSFVKKVAKKEVEVKYSRLNALHLAKIKAAHLVNKEDITDIYNAIDHDVFYTRVASASDSLKNINANNYKNSLMRLIVSNHLIYKYGNDSDYILSYRMMSDNNSVQRLYKVSDAGSYTEALNSLLSIYNIKPSTNNLAELKGMISEFSNDVFLLKLVKLAKKKYDNVKLVDTVVDKICSISTNAKDAFKGWLHMSAGRWINSLVSKGYMKNNSVEDIEKNISNCFTVDYFPIFVSQMQGSGKTRTVKALLENFCGSSYQEKLELSGGRASRDQLTLKHGGEVQEVDDYICEQSVSRLKSLVNVNKISCDPKYKALENRLVSCVFIGTTNVVKYAKAMGERRYLTINFSEDCYIDANFQEHLEGLCKYGDDWQNEFWGTILNTVIRDVRTPNNMAKIYGYSNQINKEALNAEAKGSVSINVIDVFTASVASRIENFDKEQGKFNFVDYQAVLRGMLKENNSLLDKDEDGYASIAIPCIYKGMFVKRYMDYEKAYNFRTVIMNGKTDYSNPTVNGARMKCYISIFEAKIRNSEGMIEVKDLRFIGNDMKASSLKKAPYLYLDPQDFNYVI